MKAIEQPNSQMAVERVFTPGRLRRQWMAAAYERLVPIERISRCQEGKILSHWIQEGQRCAR